MHNNNDPIVMATTMMSVRECLCSIIKLLVSTNPVVTNVILYWVPPAPTL